MDIVLLAGNSKKNKIWIEDISLLVRPMFKKVIIQYYSHWQDTQEKMVDLDEEEKKLVELVSQSTDYVLFGKSVGAILCLRAIHKDIVRPTKCIFAGTAINWADSNELNIRQWLRDYSIPTLFVQNTNDPAITSAKLRKMLLECDAPNYEFVDLPGDTHDYNAEEIAKLIKIYALKDKTA